jgi:hypothetical protein
MSRTTNECRRYERRPCHVPTTCRPAASNEMRWDATIENISQSGLRLRLRRRFEPRSGLAIELPGKDGQEPYTAYVKVVHVHTEGDGTWTLGCMLMSELSEEEFDRLVSYGNAGADAANLPRTVVSNVRLWIGVHNGHFVCCRVKRLHVAGAWPLPPGRTLNLRGVAADGSALEHAFEVVRCSRDDSGWAVQVRPVDETPTWLLARARIF